MTPERWKRIASQMELGDPLKDIDCDAFELLAYCVELRGMLHGMAVALEYDEAFALFSKLHGEAAAIERTS